MTDADKGANARMEIDLEAQTVTLLMGMYCILNWMHSKNTFAEWIG